MLSIGSQRIEYLASTSKPESGWTLQQARNLPMQLDDRRVEGAVSVHDRDAKFPRAFDALLATENIKVIRRFVHVPNANAHLERWVGSVRRECPDRLLLLRRPPPRPHPPRLRPGITTDSDPTAAST